VKENGLGLAALALSVAALGVALFGLRRTRSEPVAASRAEPTSDPRIPALEARVARLEERESALPEPAGAASRVPVEAAARGPESPLAGVGSLDRVEERLARLEARAWSIDDLRAQGFRVLRLGHDQATLDAWTARAIDTDLPVQERIAAFARLRGEIRDDSTDARIPALESILALARSTTEPGVRAAVCDALPGLTETSVRSLLLGSLATDPSPEVRVAAAGALHALGSDPEVRAALEHDLAVDADERVKDAAFLSLYDPPRHAPEGDTGR